MGIKNYKLRITENHEIDKSLNRKIMHYALSINSLRLGVLVAIFSATKTQKHEVDLPSKGKLS
jgi:hypothetical protein